MGAKGGIAGNERGMRMDIIYGECTVLYIYGQSFLNVTVALSLRQSEL